MRRRWLPLVPVAVMLFALSMNMAHIGSDWLWSAVVAVAAAAAVLIYFLQRERQEAGRRLRLSGGRCCHEASLTLLLGRCRSGKLRSHHAGRPHWPHQPMDCRERGRVRIGGHRRSDAERCETAVTPLVRSHAPVSP